MLIPVTCFTCGSEIGQKAELFLRIRKKRVAAQVEQMETTPRQALANLAMEMDLTDLFEKLGVWPDCCRTRLATAQIWTESY